MKKLVSTILSLSLGISAVAPISVQAAEYFDKPRQFEVEREDVHVHEYEWHGYDTDVCSVCGETNIHWTDDLKFITVTDNAAVRYEPRKSSDIAYHLSAGSSVTIVGRIRNESNNVWLVTSDGYYVFLDNMAFDFGTVMIQAYQLSCADSGAEEPITLSAFYDTFANDGPFDLKDDNHLGYKSDYSVMIGGCLLDEKFKGEELGNILYGYVASAAGFDEESIIQLGGTAVALADKDILGAAACAVDVNNCDSKDDVSNITKGIEYYRTENIDSLY